MREVELRVTAGVYRSTRVRLGVVGLVGALVAVVVLMSGAAQAGNKPAVTLITSVPYTISTGGGTYALADDLLLRDGDFAIRVLSGIGNVTIEGRGHKITDFTPHSVFDNGIEVGDQAGDVTVNNLTLSGFGYGILAQNVSRLTATNNTLVDNFRAGIKLDGGCGSTITANTAKGNDIGFLLARFNCSNTVKGNTVSGNQTVGIWLDDSSISDTVSSNVVSNNGTAGIKVAGIKDGDPPSVASNNTIISNDVKGNGTDLVDDNIPTCRNGWGNNNFGTKNEGAPPPDPDAAVLAYGCIR
jgi:parallel beta-helix repeat protein